MSEAASESSTNTTPQPSHTTEPQLGTPPAEPARGLFSSGLRFAEDEPVPTWAKGKTAKEILEMTQRVMSTVGHPQPASEPEPAPQTPQPQPMTQNQNQPLNPPDPSLSYSDPAEYNRQLAAYVNASQMQALQQYSSPFVSQGADTALHLSKNGRFKDVWEKWEPEVMTELASVPRQHWSVTLLDKAAQIVKSNHIDEIVRAEAERMASGYQQNGGPAVEGTEPGSTPAGRATLPLDILFEENGPEIARFKEAGLTAADIRRRFSAMGTTEEEYVANLKKSSIIANGRYTQVEAQAYR